MYLKYAKISFKIIKNMHFKIMYLSCVTLFIETHFSKIILPLGQTKNLQIIQVHNSVYKYLQNFVKQLGTRK